jgi:hypothetical protein
MTQSESIWVDLIQISKMIKIVWQLLLKVSKLSNFWIYIYFCLWSRLWDSRSSKLPNRQTHTMHVWYIYQHLPLTNHHTSPSVGKYAQHRVAIRWWCPTHFQTHDTPKYHISLVSYLPKNLPAVCIPWSSMRSHGRHGMVAMAYSWGGEYDHVLPATSVAELKLGLQHQQEWGDTMECWKYTFI